MVVFQVPETDRTLHMARDSIRILGARQHNLKNLSLEIPRERLVVITGLSGSGKSSLAFDTLYAEGQRRYVESLSAYARQFLDQLQKPEVDFIEGLSPAIAIEQRTSGGNPRSTIATQTEIYDYLRLLFASVGQPHDPVSGQPIQRLSAQQIVDRILALPQESRLTVLAPLIAAEEGEFRDVLEKLKRDGFLRARVDGEMIEIGGQTPVTKLASGRAHSLEVVIDRIVLKEGVRQRLAESVDLALKMGRNRLLVLRQGPGEAAGEVLSFSTAYSNPDTGFEMPVLTPRHFSFNSHLGACEECFGIGTRLEIDPELIVPEPDKTLSDGAIAPWRKAGKHLEPFYRTTLEKLAAAFKVSLDLPWGLLPETFRKAILFGTGAKVVSLPSLEVGGLSKRPFEGVVAQLQTLFESSETDVVRNRIRQFMGLRRCPSCLGNRLRPELLAVKVSGCPGGARAQLGIAEFCGQTIAQAQAFVETLELDPSQEFITSEVRRELTNRLRFLNEVGLGYLNLERQSGTLSGGESQRIRLATQIGSGLAGCLYVLDEPSIGLHQRDNDRLIATLKRLRDLGNSVIVVEHDEDTIRAADYVLDMGPGAGVRGGTIVAAGSPADIEATPASLTGQYLSGKMRIPVPKHRVRPASPRSQLSRGHIPPGWLSLLGVTENNLRGVDAHFPLRCLTCVTGVSGSGKSTLVDDVLRKVLARKLHRAKDRPGAHESFIGLEQVDKVIIIDQSPIGRTPRSNPVTYVGAFAAIRELFAGLPASRVRGYTSGRFSFNVKGGRCEGCEGDGVKRIEMHFMADVFVECTLCHGRRYNRETLEVTYKGRNVADILDMTVDESGRFFRNIPPIADKLMALEDVGLGYVRLGQSGATLSGGEAQRIKLAAELARKASGRTVYVLDEPTTGLHFADIHKLLEVLLKLRDAGNTLIVIEHNLEVIKCADWIIDMGPEGGALGGQIVVEGTPEMVAACEGSHTGRYLGRILK
ncbi:MAG: excinuclease ABC subunit A [Verrucomicrobia bacterium]|nr:MAG: excinuclease ABC subunit A [Verrucomicrobiota bacterium]